VATRCRLGLSWWIFRPAESRSPSALHRGVPSVHIEFIVVDTAVFPFVPPPPVLLQWWLLRIFPPGAGTRSPSPNVRPDSSIVVRVGQATPLIVTNASPALVIFSMTTLAAWSLPSIHPRQAAAANGFMSPVIYRPPPRPVGLRLLFVPLFLSHQTNLTRWRSMLYRPCKFCRPFQ